MEKNNKKKFGLLIFLNIIREKWGYNLLHSVFIGQNISLLLFDVQLPPALRIVGCILMLSHKVHGHERGLAFSI
jgi:hypothetical protein